MKAAEYETALRIITEVLGQWSIGETTFKKSFLRSHTTVLLHLEHSDTLVFCKKKITFLFFLSSFVFSFNQLAVHLIDLAGYETPGKNSPYYQESLNINQTLLKLV